jgi:hypothetical protein
MAYPKTNTPHSDSNQPTVSQFKLDLSRTEFSIGKKSMRLEDPKALIGLNITNKHKLSFFEANTLSRLIAQGMHNPAYNFLHQLSQCAFDNFQLSLLNKSTTFFLSRESDQTMLSVHSIIGRVYDEQSDKHHLLERDAFRIDFKILIGDPKSFSGSLPVSFKVASKAHNLPEKIPHHIRENLKQAIAICHGYRNYKELLFWQCAEEF